MQTSVHIVLYNCIFKCHKHIFQTHNFRIMRTFFTLNKNLFLNVVFFLNVWFFINVYVHFFIVINTFKKLDEHFFKPNSIDHPADHNPASVTLSARHVPHGHHDKFLQLARCSNLSHRNNGSVAGSRSWEKSPLSSSRVPVESSPPHATLTAPSARWVARPHEATWSEVRCSPAAVPWRGWAALLLCSHRPTGSRWTTTVFCFATSNLLQEIFLQHQSCCKTFFRNTI